MKARATFDDARRSAGLGLLLGLATGALDALFLLSALAFGGRGEDRYAVDLIRALALYALVGALYGVIPGALLARLDAARRTGVTVGVWVFVVAIALRGVHGATFFGAAPGSTAPVSFFVAAAVLAASVAMFVARRAAGPLAARLGRAVTIATAILVAVVVGAARQAYELPALVAREVAAIGVDEAETGVESGTAAATQGRPNLLLLTIDTLRADRVESDGGAASLTPGLDALATESIVFENAIAQSSWTRPSFGSIFTSRYPSEHEATWRRMNDAEGKRTSIYNRPLRADMPTLAELLDGDGYTTVAINTNVQTSSRFGFARGFDHFIDLSRPLSLLTSSLLCRWSPLRLEGPCARASSVFVEYPYLQADQIEPVFMAAMERIERSADGRPYFLWVHLMDPHVPYDAHDGGATVGYEDIERALAQQGGTAAARALVERAYAGAVRFADAHAKRILDRAIGASGNTAVVVTSDHGEEIVERWLPAAERAAGLELYRRGYGHGHTMYEEVLRVPLILRLPAGRLAGTRVGTPAMHVDIAPTLLALAGVTPHPARFAPVGRDLLALMQQPLEASARALRSEATLYGAEVKQLRVGADKIITRAADAGVERYELANDPGETRDLGAAPPPRFHAIERVLDAWIAELPVEPAAPDPASDVTAGDADLTKQLEALGYVE